MKKALLLFSLLLVVVVTAYLFWMPVDKTAVTTNENKASPAPTQDEQMVNDSIQSKKSVEPLTSALMPDLQMNNEDLPVNVWKLADEKKSEIERLMHEFNNNLSDAEIRKSIKIKIDQKLAEYNKIILPMAVEQVKASR